MDAFFRNAQEIFDVARVGASDGSSDFALLIRPDGALHLIMDSPVSLEAAAVHSGAQTAYFVSRSDGGVRVTGQTPGRSCVLEEGGRSSAAFRLLRDQPLYQKMVSGSGGGSSRGGSGGSGGGTSSSGVIVRPILAA